MKQIFNLKQLWIISLILFLLPTFASAWDDVNCNYRLPIIITGSSTDHVEEPVYIDVTAGHSWTDGQIAFYDSDGDSLNWGNYTKNSDDYEGYVFVNTTAGTNSTIYFYYGGATCGGSATATRNLFDDFENSNQTTPILWTEELTWSGDCVEQNGRMELVATGSTQDNCWAEQTMNTGYWTLVWEGESSDFLGGFQMGDDHVANGDYTFMNRDVFYTSPARFEVYDDVDAGYIVEQSWACNDSINYTSKLYRDTLGNFEYYIDEVLISSWNDVTTTDFPYIMLRALGSGANTGGIYVYEIQHWDIDHNIYYDSIDLVSTYYEETEESSTINSITINTPLNVTYYTDSITLNFTAIDDTLTNINTWYTIDGTETYYNATNNTDEIINLTFTSEGIHYVNITSENSDYNRSNIVYFTTNFYDLESDGFTEDVYLSGEQWYYFQYIRYYVTSATGWNNYLTLNSTNYTLSLFSSNATHYIYYATDNFAEITTDEELYYNSTLSNSYVNETSATRSIELFTFNLDDCSVYTVPTINFYGYDELTDILSNFTLNGVFVVSSSEDSTTSQTFNFSLSGNNTHALCLKENNVTYNLNAELEYYNATSEVRNYYLIDVNLTSTPQSVNLYLIPSTTDSKQILMTVQNENGVIESDVIIYLNKFSYETNSYKTVAMVKSDDLGQAVSYIYAPDNTYQFILIQEGVTVNTYDSIIPIPDATTDVIDILLQTSPSSFGEFWDYYDSITGNCEFNNSTKLMTCTYADTSGILQNVYLDVVKKTLLDETTVCNEYLSSASGTLTCDLGSNSTREYFYSLITEFQQTNYTLQSGIIVVDVPTNYNDVGYMSAFIFIGVLATAVLISEIMVLLTFIGLALMSYGNLIYVSTETLVGLAITTIILIAIMRNKK